MAEQGSISIWIEHLKAGDSKAAQPLWEHYYRRLVGLARKKLGDVPRRVFDEEDIVQSAFMSFCQRAEAGQFPDPADRDELWALLAVITARKAANKLVHHGRAKRGGNRAAPDADDLRTLAEIIGREPTPQFTALLVEQLERVMDLLHEPTLRVITLWKLEGRTNSEISRHLDCSLSAVERKLRLIRELLASELPLIADEEKSP